MCRVSEGGPEGAKKVQGSARGAWSWGKLPWWFRSAGGVQGVLGAGQGTERVKEVLGE